MAGRFRGVAVVWGALLAIGLFACATPTQTTTSTRSDDIADVLVEREGTATVVTLTGLAEPEFTAFAERDPERVIVDLAGVESREGRGPVVVYDGVVEEITISPFASSGSEAMTRVEISMVAAARFEVTNTDAGVRIWMEAEADATAPEGVAESIEPPDPWAMEPTAAVPAMSEPTAGMSDMSDASDMSDMSGMSDTSGMSDLSGMTELSGMSETVEPDAGEFDSAMASPATGSPATKLMSVNVRAVGGGSLIELGADGTIPSAVSFTLENPGRLVVDLPGMLSEVANDRIDVGSSQVERIRVGQHDDMVRVVLDAGEASDGFEGRRLAPGATGLWIALGSDAELDMAFEAARSAPAPAVVAAAEEAFAVAEPDDSEAAEMLWGSEPAAMADAGAEAPEMATPDVEAVELDVAGADPVAVAPDEGAVVTVYGVEFDIQEAMDRLVVLADKPMDYLVYEPDPETFVISIARAEIEPEAAVRIVPEARGPVSLVTAFAQPDVETSEVRVVVQRAADLKPEISRRGSLLIIDFPRTGALAATPPMLKSPPAEADAGETPEPMLASSSTPGMAGMDAAVPAAIPLAGDAVETVSVSMPSAAAPASLEPPAAIELLQEGGLIDGKEYSGRRISLDFKEVDIADVLRLIAEVSDLNVIAGDEVRGKVTIRLVDVPWDQALDIILLTKGLGFMRIGNVLRIAPNDVIAQEEEARLQERRAKERLEDLVVKLQPVNYADAQDISRMVSELLTERGTVNVDKRTNTLVLKDIPSVIDEATALIKAVDTQTPQVMIEAKIVEAKLKFSREFGSVWSIGVQPLSDAWDASSPLAQNRGGNMFRLRPSQLSGGADGSTNGTVFANPITNLPTALGNMGAFLLDEKINLDVQLQAAETNGDGKVISSPRVVTMDNSQAKIEQGVSIPFQTFENGDAQLEFVDAVLKLDVTPHITANKAIIMKIKVTRNAPDDSVFTLTGSPAIAKNEVDTETLVQDGQTLVLGGIYTMGKSKRQSRVPYLHRIPILGGAFRNNEVSDDRQELLIFVTPRIVQADHAAF